MFNIGKTQQRWAVYQAYGTISDQVTGGQTTSWARGGSGYCVYLNPSSTTNPLVWEFYVPVTASTSFTLSFYHKITSGFNGSLKVTIYDSDDDYTKLLDAESVTFTDDGAWHQYTSTSVTPTNTGFCRVKIEAYNGSTTGDIGIDDISVSAGSSVDLGDLNRYKDELIVIDGSGTGSGSSEHSWGFVQ
ncbi:MAG: hypothetical protein ACTSPI_17205 [Candidatus Heimdallarchaeaceae archaeon]